MLFKQVIGTQPGHSRQLDILHVFQGQTYHAGKIHDAGP